MHKQLSTPQYGNSTKFWKKDILEQNKSIFAEMLIESMVKK